MSANSSRNRLLLKMKKNEVKISPTHNSRNRCTTSKKNSNLKINDKKQACLKPFKRGLFWGYVIVLREIFSTKAPFRVLFILNYNTIFNPILKFLPRVEYPMFSTNSSLKILVTVPKIVKRVLINSYFSKAFTNL